MVYDGSNAIRRGEGVGTMMTCRVDDGVTCGITDAAEEALSGLLIREVVNNRNR